MKIAVECIWKLGRGGGVDGGQTYDAYAYIDVPF